MSESTEGPAAPESGDELPTFGELAADPEIAALLDFEPVPRKVVVKDGWSPDRQREFIARLASHGSPSTAAGEVTKDITSARKLYHHPQGASFAAAWEAAVALAQARIEAAAPAPRPRAGTPPGIDRRRRHAPGQPFTVQDLIDADVEAERRAEEVKDSISNKLLRCRRLYLAEIADSPGKRAAFEILTELPIDWDKARNMEAQIDEPFRRPNMRRPDMLLTAENGWMGEMAHGPDKRAELRRMLDEYRAEQGMEPIRWDDEAQGDEE